MISLIAALATISAPAAAYEGERITYYPVGNVLIVDGEDMGGSKRDKLDWVKTRLEACPATADGERKRKLKSGVGQGMSYGGLGAMMLVSVTNPYALGAVLGFGTVSVVGSSIWISSMRYTRALDTYEAECMGDAPEPTDFVDPDDVGDPDL